MSRSFPQLPSRSFSWGCTWLGLPPGNQVRAVNAMIITAADATPSQPNPCQAYPSKLITCAYSPGLLNSSYHICHCPWPLVIFRPTLFEIPRSAWTSDSDAMMFSVIVHVSISNGISLPGGQPSLFRTIVEDWTVYFLVMFSSHLLSLVMLLVTRVSSATLS